MSFKRKLIAPIVSAAVATVVVTSFATVLLVKGDLESSRDLIKHVSAIALSSTLATVMVMSLLYHELRTLMAELESREAAAQHLAIHDQLTGLPNRALLNDRLEQALLRYQREGEKSALLMLDLDYFKQINDTLGHYSGDLLIIEVARRLKMLVRQTDTVARIGGDEFAILMSQVRGPSDVKNLCDRIIHSLCEPFTLGDREGRVGVSIGAVIVSARSSQPADLLRKADITLYRAKGAGRGCFRIFSDEMDAAVQRRDKVESHLRSAMAEENIIDLHYQPQISKTGTLTGFECLLRWHDAELGVVDPLEIIPIAEQSGLIHGLGEFIFRRACQMARRWPELFFAVNLSPAQFRTAHLVDRLRGIAAEEGVNCHQIEFEITENLLIDHGDLCTNTVAELRRIGFRIALDDFGTGYSSLSYLRDFDVDKIKLDRSFLESPKTDQSIAIIKAAVDLGHAIGLEVVAEGVATKEHERIALAAGCDGLQGFLYAPALSADEVEAYLKENRKRMRAA